MIEEFFQMFPARALFLIAGQPDLVLDAESAESMDRMGWLPGSPAGLCLCSGTCPIVTEGRHRLSYLKKKDELDLLVPVIIKVRTLGDGLSI